MIDGAAATIPQDTYSVDDDTDLTELTPDRDRKPRLRGSGPDMGAFERYEPGACAGDVNQDGFVDVDDLISVILGWGPCPALPAACHANIFTTGTSATNVDVDDLVTVILTWGPCPDNSGLSDALPQSLQDCKDVCTKQGLTGQDWTDCFMRCYQAIQ